MTEIKNILVKEGIILFDPIKSFFDCYKGELLQEIYEKYHPEIGWEIEIKLDDDGKYWIYHDNIKIAKPIPKVNGTSSPNTKAI